MKKILILGGGFLQTFVIAKAKEMGYHVLVLDADPHAVGFCLADEHAVINIVDEEACLAYARSHKVDGVLTAATDFGVMAMSRIADEMGLPGIHYSSAKRIKNKASVRRHLKKAKADDTGDTFEIHSLEEIPDILPQVQFPVMVKPCDGSGSRGTSRVDSPQDFPVACSFAMCGSISHRAMAEPFIEGQEYGVESFVNQGEIHVLAVMRKDMTSPPYYAELGHAIPSGLSQEMDEKVRLCVKRALEELEVNHGSVNMDLIVTPAGNVHIIDIGARMGGNLIGSHIVPIGTGIDYMGNMIRAAVGDPVDFSPVNEPSSVATKLLALTPGKIKALPDFERISREKGVIIEHHLHVGDEIREYHTNLDGCGYVLAKESDVDASIRKAAVVKALIDHSIVRD